VAFLFALSFTQGGCGSSLLESYCMFPVKTNHIESTKKECFRKTFKVFISFNPKGWTIKHWKKTSISIDEKFTMHWIRVVFLNFQWVELVARKLYQSREERSNVLLQVHRGKLLREELYK
jgi:hypothetical protein